MAKQLTERQEGIQDFRNMLREHNAIVAGDKGILKAYRKFLKDNNVTVKSPTQQQADYEGLLSSAAPMMEPNMRAPRPKGD